MAIKPPLVLDGTSIEELQVGDSLAGVMNSAPSATDNALVRFDGTSGSVVQNGNITQDDNGNLANVNGITFDTTPTSAPSTAGSMFWDSGDGTPSVVLNANTSLQLGQENVALVYNGSGSTIPKGSVVAVNGAQGQRPSVTLADADSEALSAATLGIATEAIANGAEGFICTFGLVRGINTSAFTAGDDVYLSQTAGQFTATRPSAPAHTVFLGWVIKVNASSGELFVNINNGWELDELHNVLITSPASGNTLIYDASVGVWKNANLTDGTGINITEGAGSITIANTGVTSLIGTANEVDVSASTGAVTISLPATINANTTGSAATLTTGRTIAITGDMTYTSSAFNGSSNVTGTGTLATVNSNVGTYGTATAVPAVTVNAKGLVTGVTSTSIAIPSSAITDKGSANGVASLDSGGKVPTSQLPSAVLSGVTYQGAWNASTNSPTLTSSVGTQGYYYVVSVAGTTNLNGITDWQVGDWAIYNGSAWQKVDNTDAVTSVNGSTGAVTVSYATLGTVPVNQGGTNATDAATARTNLGLAIGTNVQAYDADLAAIAALSPTADNFIVGNGTTWILETPAQARTSLGATTVGSNLLTLTNPSAITFPRVNADNTVSMLDAATFRSAIGAGTSSTTGTVTSVGVTAGTGMSVSGSPITSSGSITVGLANTAVTAGSYTNANITVDAQGRITSAANGTSASGTVTSVSGTGTVSGLTLTGTVTSSGSLTLGGNLSITADMIYDSFTATASQTTFSTSQTYTSGKIDVYANGVKMRNGSDVTVTSGSSVVFATGLPSGTLVDLVYPI